ncbi:MAG: glycosyltransferase family 1 protein [Desulfuromonadaceae bacterium]|nr:glycosyltransferase family 1 protein [Desulfuromonadaceae bacterium]
MRIGVILQSGLQAGGGFSHELALVDLLSEHNDARWEFMFFVTQGEHVALLAHRGIQAILLDFSLIDRLRFGLHRIKSLLVPARSLPWPASPLDRILSLHAIDLVFFSAPSSLALDIRYHNYVFSVWDLCHLDRVEFPEVNFGGEFEARELLFSQALPKAVAIIVDSQAGRDNLLSRYRLDGERIAVLPFLSDLSMQEGDGSTNVRSVYRLDGEYIFYPAQFWPHKNHGYILDVVKTLFEQGEPVHAVFSGSDKGNLASVLRQARHLGIAEFIHHIGFVDRAEMYSLYRQALALVMPTYFGPTNIPPLEAFQAGCPVCYPNLPGLRDQVGDAAFLFDLNDSATLVAALRLIKTDKVTVQKKIAQGKYLVASWTSADYWRVLERIFHDYDVLSHCWKEP